MTRFRYLIEVSGDDLWPFALTTVDPEGESQGSSTYESMAAAQDMAQRSVDVPLTWKAPPAAWQPDALLVTQYLDDGVDENRDD